MLADYRRRYDEAVAAGHIQPGDRRINLMAADPRANLGDPAARVQRRNRIAQQNEDILAEAERMYGRVQANAPRPGNPPQDRMNAAQAAVFNARAQLHAQQLLAQRGPPPAYNPNPPAAAAPAANARGFRPDQMAAPVARPQVRRHRRVREASR